jgi:hypothetical protein
VFLCVMTPYVDWYHTALRYNTEDPTMDLGSCKNLKFHIALHFVCRRHGKDTLWRRSRRREYNIEMAALCIYELA